MNPLTKAARWYLGGIRADLKAMTRMSFPRGGAWWGGRLYPNTRIDYERAVKPDLNSAVMACVGWVQRTFPEAPIVLEQRNREQEWEPVEEHPFLDLMEQPNPYYDGQTLEKALLADYMLTGNAYALLRRTRGGEVRQQWWAPSFMIEPRWPQDGSEFITHYDYRPNGVTVRVDPEDVLHLRDGLDPHNMRKGLSKLASLFREIYTDDEAANMTAVLLKNLGVPGLVISPEGDASADPGDVDATRAFFKERFGGDNRGEPLVMGAPTKVQQFGASFKDMNVRDLRRVPEERVSAVLGIPAVVIGLGAGLDRATFANYAEAREAAFENAVVPLQRSWAMQLRNQLLRHWVGEDLKDLRQWRVSFDLSDVRVLQEDENQKSERLTGQLRAGGIMLSEYRRELGYDVDEKLHEVWYQPKGLDVIPKDELGKLSQAESIGGSTPGTGAPAEGGRTDGQPPFAPRAPEDRPASEQRAWALKQGLTGQQLMLAFRRDAERLEAAFEGRFLELLEDLGRMAASAALAAMAETRGFVPQFKEGDEIIAQRIMEAIGISAWATSNVRPAYEAHYHLVAQTTVHTVKAALGVSFDLTDDQAQRIIATGGRRVGLLDLERKTRTSLLSALAQGRLEGEGVDALVRRIRNDVPRGPWRDAGTRAEVVARTETKYAQNLSALESYRSSGFEVELLDAQLGASDAECEDRNGRIMSVEDAEVELHDEHPNGTLTVLPVVREWWRPTAEV